MFQNSLDSRPVVQRQHGHVVPYTVRRPNRKFDLDMLLDEADIPCAQIFVDLDDPAIDVRTAKQSCKLGC